MRLKPKEDGRRVTHIFLYLRYMVEIHVSQMCPIHSGFGIPISSLRKISTQRYKQYKYEDTGNNKARSKKKCDWSITET